MTGWWKQEKAIMNNLIKFFVFVRFLKFSNFFKNAVLPHLREKIMAEIISRIIYRNKLFYLCRLMWDSVLLFRYSNPSFRFFSMPKCTSACNSVRSTLLYRLRFNFHYLCGNIKKKTVSNYFVSFPPDTNCFSKNAYPFENYTNYCYHFSFSP